MSKVRIDINEVSTPNIKPALSANALFHFMNRLDYLKYALQNKALVPRYCKENITFLNLKVNNHTISEVAYPEKCFCDITVHNVSKHIETYGSCGIGFPKEWGISHGIQPIQYVNVKSNLIKDFKKCFKKSTKISADNYVAQDISDYLVSYMLYIKPIEGDNENRVTGDLERVCFTDECEWRYVPDLSEKEMNPILFDNDICQTDEYKVPIIQKYNDALRKLPDVWLDFSYNDIKYLLVHNYTERDELIDCIINLGDGTDEKQKMGLVSKIIVLDNAKEDF